MYDVEGTYYRIWRMLWWATRWLIRSRPGEYALRMPSDENIEWWKEKYLWPAIRRTISSGKGGLATIGFGFASVFASLLFLALLIPWPIWKNGLLVALCVSGPIALIVAVCHAAYVALRALPPEQYAEILLAGRTTTDQFRILAYEIHVACQQFVEDAEALNDFATSRILEYITPGARYKFTNETSFVQKVQTFSEEAELLDADEPADAPDITAAIQTFCSDNNLDPAQVRKTVRKLLQDRMPVKSPQIQVALQALGPENLSINDDEIGNAIRNASAQNDSKLAEYERSLVRNRPHLARIYALKKRAADELNISQRCLCDHILQYSPEMQRYLTQKYGENFAELIGDAGTNWGNPYLRRRLVRLAQQNRRIYAKSKSRMDEVKKLFKYESLHDPIHRLAAQHSSSGSLLRYAHTVTAIAKGVHGATQPDDKKVQLRFFYRKHRSHPGTDLHDACIRLCREAEKSVVESVLEAEKLQKLRRAHATENPNGTETHKRGYCGAHSFVKNRYNFRDLE